MEKLIFIIDDEESILKMLIHWVKNQWGYNVKTFTSGIEALSALSENPDLILLDIMLPVIDWITVCKKILEQKKVPIIMITAKDEIGDRILWLESGADDYIVKPFDLWELVARINAVLRRWNKEIYDEIQYGDISIFLAKKEIFKNNEKIDLTLKEFLILEYLIQNKNQAVSRTDIINYIWWWEDSMFEWDAKLDVYISNLRKKLDKSLIETIKWFWYRINMD